MMGYCFANKSGSELVGVSPVLNLSSFSVDRSAAVLAVSHGPWSLVQSGL